jgi:hypothetical protein
MSRSEHMSARSSKAASNRAIHADVDGAPFSIGQSVTVCGLTDETADRSFLRKRGIVAYFDYYCGCGQTYPQDPMIGVCFPSDKVAEFWREELEADLPSPGQIAKRSRDRGVRPTKTRQDAGSVGLAGQRLLATAHPYGFTPNCQNKNE